MSEQYQQLTEEINALRQEVNSLKANTTIPLDIAEAFKVRILNGNQFLSLSSKSASSENIAAVTAVDFVGQTVTTNTVLDNPDGFLQIKIRGVNYYLPYFS